MDILFCLISPLFLTYYVLALDSPDCPEGCKEVMYFPDKICHKFWRCFDDTAYLFICPRGRQWNPVLNNCDLPESAGCTGMGWRNISSECPNTITTTTTIQPVTQPQCENEKDGTFYPNNECSKFWTCANGIAYQFDCPKGLYWNSNLNVCDWPLFAGCTQGKVNM
ncbi:unnamed protein product [Ceutorhynchus assimilis]|uniref:Chitin-binding type-2 domain-containing protein n=1 Tax=Ceutorhynchus assimilis TaxID=467358 RepID=A0A9N9QLV8_9CUCU|nr:unnamed protein product [Ceutorhynchus assimilis]